MKNTATVLALALGLAAATHTPAPAHYGADAAPTDAQVSVAENAGSELLGPHWSVGDEWIVETETRSEQYAKGNEREVVWSKPVRWKFCGSGRTNRRQELKRRLFLGKIH